MAVRKFKPTTPGQRHKVIGVFRSTTAVKVNADAEDSTKKLTVAADGKSVVFVTPEADIGSGKEVR